MRGLLVTAAGVAALLVAPALAAPAPQVVDPAGDANAGTYWSESPDNVTPVGSQPYADVTAVRFATTTTAKRVGRRTVRTVTGFTVTMTLSAAPVPPAEATGIYRVIAIGPKCLLGIDHYTRALPDAAAPRTAFYDTCGGGLRRTPLAAPAVGATTITWTVPLAAVPRDTKVGVGATLTDLHFETYVAHQATCLTAETGGEQPPCAAMLDGTFRRTATFTIR